MAVILGTKFNFQTYRDGVETSQQQCSDHPCNGPATNFCHFLRQYTAHDWHCVWCMLRILIHNAPIDLFCTATALWSGPLKKGDLGWWSHFKRWSSLHMCDDLSPAINHDRKQLCSTVWWEACSCTAQNFACVTNPRSQNRNNRRHPEVLGWSLYCSLHVVRWVAFCMHTWPGTPTPSTASCHSQIVFQVGAVCCVHQKLASVQEKRQQVWVTCNCFWVWAPPKGWANCQLKGVLYVGPAQTRDWFCCPGKA